MATTKILIVEDELIVAMDIQNKLENLGYDASYIVSSGEKAILTTEEIKPDLVLMDIILKGDIDGVEATKQINSRFGIPVIYLTGNADENTLKRIQNTNPLGYLFKPFNEMELHTIIEEKIHNK